MRLSLATTAQQASLMRQFQSATAVKQWGGEGFRLPLQSKSFLEQLQLPDTQSFALWDQQDKMLAFGQVCNRFERIHLARLLVLPQFRGRQLSQSLISGLTAAGLQRWPGREASLFVFRNNHIALRCYQKLGFIPTKQPSTNRSDLHFMTLHNPACLALVKDVPVQLITQGIN